MRRRERRSVSRIRQMTGENIRSLRLERKWTQEELAYRSGLSTAHIGRIERGELDAGLTTLETLAAALGAELEDLVADQKRRRLKELGLEEYAGELAVIPMETRADILRLMDDILTILKEREEGGDHGGPRRQGTVL